MSARLKSDATLDRAIPLDRRTSRLTWLYISALTAVAALSLTGQLLVQRALRQQRGDSTIVNLAGRQRMLSQRLTKAALAWNYATKSSARADRSAEIRSTLALWQRSHRGLQQGDAEMSLAASRSPVVVEQFARLQPIFDQMVFAADKLLASSDATEQQTQLRTLLEREPQFLAAMDAVVFQLDREAQARVAWLQKIEWLLLTLTLLVLVGEGYLVFRPAVQRIRQAAHELQVAKEAAESANEQKTRFLATLSHELRNPLHAIMGNTELALESPLTPAQRTQITTIGESAQSLLRLVNDLLDLACIQAGKLRVQNSPFDLRVVIHRCLDMVHPLAQRKKLQLAMDLPTGELAVIGDSLRVQQVLLNLLGNAVKFTDTGKVRLAMTVSGTRLRLEVADTGAGIPEDMQQAIFAAFTQVDGSTRREFSGVGLGLAISAGLVELMHGRIGVDSIPGSGSLFWFDLPLATERSQDTVSTQPLDHVARRIGVSPAHGCRILVVEDDAVNRRLLADLLHLLGHSTVVAADGLEALEHYRKEEFDLVLLDWHMPQVDGLDLAKQIRKLEAQDERPRVSIVAISAAAAIADDQQAQQAGVDQILLKPVGLEQLRQALLPFATDATDEPPTANEPRWQGVLTRLQGNHGLLRGLAEIFLAELPKELQHLQELLIQRNFHDLSRAAHLLKGQAATFDAAGLIAATTELEKAAVAEELLQVEAQLEQVQVNAAQLRTELRHVLSNAPLVMSHTAGRA